MRVISNRSEGRMVAGLRNVVMATNPQKLKLSPDTVLDLMRSAGPGEVEVVEMGMENKSKHISFKGVPIILSLKLSHHQRRMMMGEPIVSSRKMAEC